jgi:hypothetical protein
MEILLSGTFHGQWGHETIDGSAGLALGQSEHKDNKRQGKTLLRAFPQGETR